MKNIPLYLAVLALYFFSTSQFLSWLVPEYRQNVNYNFVSDAWKYVLLLLLILSAFIAVVNLIFLWWLKVKKKEFGTFQDVKKQLFHREKIFPGDLFLILLPLTPIIQYLLNNQAILSVYSSLYILVIFSIFSGIFIFLIPVLIGFIGSKRTLMILGLSFSFTITNMAILSSEFFWLERGSFNVQFLFFGSVFILGWALNKLIGKKFLHFIVVVFFMVNSAIPLIKHKQIELDSAITDNKLVELVGLNKPRSTPNIYLLVYDAYVPNEVMMGYGIDNSTQEKKLEQQGFTIYPHVYSVGATSINTMSRVLNASTRFYGNPVKARSGDGVVQNLLKTFGYETHGIFYDNLFFRGLGSHYDFPFPKPVPKKIGGYSSHQLLVKAIFMGEFRFDVSFNTPSSDEFVKYKLNVFENVPSKPRFIDMHSPYPGHSQNSGVCLSDQTELFEENLKMTNDEMDNDIAKIIQNDSDAIIVVAGDHGPYLTKNCFITGGRYDAETINRSDIQDRYGTFLAIKWPTNDFSKYDDITVLQDLFPSIFAYLFKDDRFLEAKVNPLTLEQDNTSGVFVNNGIIYGGKDDGKPLYKN